MTQARHIGKVVVTLRLTGTPALLSLRPGAITAVEQPRDLAGQKHDGERERDQKQQVQRGEQPAGTPQPVIERLNRANGVAVDLELARFEADHARDRGANPRRAVAMARRALAERPTIYASDTLGWALRQAGRPGQALPHARAAVRLGTRDALLWYHLAAAEADLGMTAAARRHLAEAFAISPYLTVRDQPAALALAGRLHLPAPSRTSGR
jgi:Flp pilus assembly protein TadD